MHVTVNFLGLFFRTGKIFFGLTRFSCLSVRMTDNFSASFGKSVIHDLRVLNLHFSSHFVYIDNRDYLKENEGVNLVLGIRERL
jgi:hypothetical protein